MLTIGFPYVLDVSLA